MSHRFGSSLSAVLLFLVPWNVSAADGPGVAPPNLMIDLRLLDAVFRGEAPDDTPSPVLLLLRRTGDGWSRAWGTAREFNHNVHAARLSDVQLTETRFQVALDLSVNGDARGNPGGLGRYTVQLSRGGDGPYRGTFEGMYQGVAVAGKAEATVLPGIELPPNDFVPPAPDEHPRILFRRSDLERLRVKARTPLGQAALEAMEGPVGLGMQYQLTGDRRYAQLAMPLVEEFMARGLLSDQFGNNVGDRLEQTALAYDLCFDVWSVEFKRRVERYLRWAADGVLRARRDTHQAVNWHVASNWSAPLYAGAAFAGLALWGKAGPPPIEPLVPNTGAEIPPADGYQPGRGVPVFDFRSDEMPPDWIFAGGFKTDDAGGDPLQDLGGARRARPQVGDAARFGGKTFRFAALPEEADKGYWSHENYDGGARLIDITNAVGREYFSTNYFYTAVRNDRDGWVRFEPGMHSAVVSLNGVRLHRGQVARLQAGLYPMLVEAYIDQINPWGRQLMRPRLVEIAEDEARRLIAQQRAEHERIVADWRQQRAEWEQTGGLDLACRDLFERSRHMMYLFCREAVGDGGFQSELAHYSGIAEKAPARYASAHLQMFGYPVSPQPDIEQLLPRKMFVHVYPRDGEPAAQEINGTPKVDNELFAALLPTVRKEWQPAVLWGWQQHAGFDGRAWARLVDRQPVLALLNYPLDMQPEHPSRRLPLAWRADDFGFYGFRDRWQDEQDFVCQVFARAYHLGGWNSGNAGTLRLAGLGHVWATGPADRNRHRGEESVVQLPEDPGINASANGRVTCVQTHPDGSGVVSIDLQDVYAGARRLPGSDKRLRLYTRYGNHRQDDAFVDLGIRGMRCIGVDYSGRSGAPCVVALVDTIRGGGRKVWTWQLPPGGKDTAGDATRTSTEGNSFLVRKDDGATLHGVFASGQQPVAEVRMTTMTGGAGSSAGKQLQRPIHGVFAESRDRDADFFFVATIQNDRPPEIRVRGRGLNSVVTVGGLQVRYDGQKIVFESVH